MISTFLGYGLHLFDLHFLKLFFVIFEQWLTFLFDELHFFFQMTWIFYRLFKLWMMTCTFDTSRIIKNLYCNFVVCLLFNPPQYALILFGGFHFLWSMTPIFFTCTFSAYFFAVFGRWHTIFYQWLELFCQWLEFFDGWLATLEDDTLFYLRIHYWRTCSFLIDDFTKKLKFILKFCCVGYYIIHQSMRVISLIYCFALCLVFF